MIQEDQRQHEVDGDSGTTVADREAAKELLGGYSAGDAEKLDGRR